MIHIRRLIPALFMTPLFIIFGADAVSKGNWIFAIINLVALIVILFLGYFTQKVMATR